jgi:hypothetical protein
VSKDRYNNEIMRGDAQFALLAIVMHLHSKRDLGKPDSGVTVQRILELFARGAAHGSHCELASPTRIKAMIALLRYGQALIPGGQAGDMRCRPLVPTAKLIAPFRNWLSAFLQTVNIVLPLPEGALSAPEALLAEVMSYNVYAYIYSGFTLHESFTSVQNCMSREAGHTIFMALIAGLSSLEDGQVVSHTPIDELSLRLNISRGTVRNVLNDFKRDGHIQFDRGGHRVVISQAFKNICNQWVALELLWVYAFVTLAWQCL